MRRIRSHCSAHNDTHDHVPMLSANTNGGLQDWQHEARLCPHNGGSHALRYFRVTKELLRSSQLQKPSTRFCFCGAVFESNIIGAFCADKKMHPLAGKLSGIGWLSLSQGKIKFLFSSTVRIAHFVSVDMQM